MGCFDTGNAFTGRWFRLTLKLIPPSKHLVSSRKNPWRHQGLFEGTLRLSLKIRLPEIDPSPVGTLKFLESPPKIARFKDDIGIDQQRVSGLNLAQREVGRFTKPQGTLDPHQP